MFDVTHKNIKILMLEAKACMVLILRILLRQKVKIPARHRIKKPNTICFGISSEEKNQILCEIVTKIWNIDAILDVFFKFSSTSPPHHEPSIAPSPAPAPWQLCNN